MKKLLLLFAISIGFQASAQTVADTVALEAHAKAARYKLISQGMTVLPGDADYYDVARKDYDRLIAGQRTKNLLYRAAICKIKSTGVASDPAKNAALLLIAKQGMQDVLDYEKQYGANDESTRYREGLQRNILTLGGSN